MITQTPMTSIPRDRIEESLVVEPVDGKMGNMYRAFNHFDLHRAWAIVTHRNRNSRAMFWSYFEADFRKHMTGTNSLTYLGQSQWPIIVVFSPINITFTLKWHLVELASSSRSMFKAEFSLVFSFFCRYPLVQILISFFLSLSVDSRPTFPSRTVWWRRKGTNEKKCYYQPSESWLMLVATNRQLGCYLKASTQCWQEKMGSWAVSMK